jgi:peptidoglycan/xylan/chitin deacetylase (PgdA/CDA1 family)
MRKLALAYHDVTEPGGRGSGRSGPGAGRFTLTRDRFARHLQAIQESEIHTGLVTEERATEASELFLTFDDGGFSATTTIAPMLAELGWPGHFFVITGEIGKPGFMSADAIRELRDAGHLVGSHSHTHRRLTRLSAAEIDDEWRRSKALLEDLLGERIRTLSIPTGFYAERVGRLATEAGYRHLFCSEPWLTPRPVGESGRLYGRFSVIGKTPADRVGALCRLSRRAVWREAGVWQARKGAKTVLGPAYFRIRARVL